MSEPKPAKCHCGSSSWGKEPETSRYTCVSCYRPLWMPIATAPKNGTIVLGYFSNDNGTFFLSEIMWVNSGELVCGGDDDDAFVGPQAWFSLLARKGVFPTHWMPLPELPKLD